MAATPAENVGTLPQDELLTSGSDSEGLSRGRMIELIRRGQCRDERFQGGRIKAPGEVTVVKIA
jgi:hypothetical protein